MSTVEKDSDQRLSPPSQYRWLHGADLFALFVFGSVVTISIWVEDGGLTSLFAGGSSTLSSIGQITGLASVLCALSALLMSSRLRAMEVRWGLDHMLSYHRWLGISTAVLVLVHVVADTWARASLSGESFVSALASMLSGEDWMVAALVGFLLIMIISISSWRRIKNYLSYETWYFIHLLAYLAVLAGFAHQLTSGADFASNPFGWWWWVGLYLLCAVVVLYSRLGSVVSSAVRSSRIIEVHPESSEVVSFTVASPRLSRIEARGGQFFHLRVISPGMWWHTHPFSLSKAPTRSGLRFTVKDLGDATSQLTNLRPGTRVWLEGPYGVFTSAKAKGEKLVLVAAGVGVTPILAILDDCEPEQQPVVIVRVRHERDLPHREELENLVRARNGTLHVIVGPRHTRAHDDPIGSIALRRMVPDMAYRHVFVCGPNSFSMSVLKASRQAGARKGNVHIERFGF